jgi:hypothetical protein
VSTNNLKTAIEQACSDLTWINESLAKIGSAGTLSNDSNAFFNLSSGLAVQLEQAKSLLLVRDTALKALRAFPGQPSTTSVGQFLYNGIDVQFKLGRFLFCQNYAATTWALYDTLSKISGVLCCNDDYSKNLTKPVKLYEDFVQGKNCVGARIRDHLKGGYGWPISISYLRSQTACYISFRSSLPKVIQVYSRPFNPIQAVLEKKDTFTRITPIYAKAIVAETKRKPDQTSRQTKSRPKPTEK